MPKALLGLQQFAASDEEGGHGGADGARKPQEPRLPTRVAKPVAEGAHGQPRVVGALGGKQLWARAAVGSRPAPVSTLDHHSSTVWRPRVRRRFRPVLVGPSTSAETPRSIASMRPSRSSKRSATSSPRRAPESAARRTSSRICSALCRRFASRGSAEATSASAASADGAPHRC